MLGWGDSSPSIIASFAHNNSHHLSTVTTKKPSVNGFGKRVCKTTPRTVIVTQTDMGSPRKDGHFLKGQTWRDVKFLPLFLVYGFMTVQLFTHLLAVNLGISERKCLRFVSLFKCGPEAESSLGFF